MTKNRKHIGIAVSLTAAAAVLHGYEHRDLLFFLWSMAPYIACLLVLVLSPIAIHVVAAAGVSLIMDIFMHYSVVTSDNSTAVLGYLWMPVWNLVIFVPLAMWITLTVTRQRDSENAL